MGSKKGKNNNRAGCADGIRRKAKNNDAARKSTNDTRQRGTNCQLTGSVKAQAVLVYDLKNREFLDYFRDGVNGLGVREQTVSDGCDDVEGALHEFPWVSAIQLPGAEDAFDAIP